MPQAVGPHAGENGKGHNQDRNNDQRRQNGAPSPANTQTAQTLISPYTRLIAAIGGRHKKAVAPDLAAEILSWMPPMAWTFPLGVIFPVSARCRAGQPKQPPQHGSAAYGDKFEATEALTPGVLG